MLVDILSFEIFPVMSAMNENYGRLVFGCDCEKQVSYYLEGMWDTMEAGMKNERLFPLDDIGIGHLAACVRQWYVIHHLTEVRTWHFQLCCWRVQ